MVDKFARKVVKNNERFLVFWCLVVRVSENESLERTLGEQRFADKHSKTQTASVSFMFISWHLKKFYEY